VEARHAIVHKGSGLPAEEVMEVSVVTKQFEKDLARNIALLAKVFKSKGYGFQSQPAPAGVVAGDVGK